MHAGAFSPECCLSLSLTYTALTCEALFLLLEHELLEAASDPSFIPPDHPVLTSSHLRSILGNLTDPAKTGALKGALPGSNLNLSSLLAPPTPPDPELLSQFFVRCGVNRRFSAEEAVETILRPMLQKYRALLPLDTWRAVCMASMNVVKSSVDSMMKNAAKEDVSGEKAAKNVTSECSSAQSHEEASDMEGSRRSCDGVDVNNTSTGAENTDTTEAGGGGEGLGVVRHVGESLSRRGRDVGLKQVTEDLQKMKGHREDTGVVQGVRVGVGTAGGATEIHSNANVNVSVNGVANSTGSRQESNSTTATVGTAGNAATGTVSIGQEGVGVQQGGEGGGGCEPGCSGLVGGDKGSKTAGVGEVSTGGKFEGEGEEGMGWEELDAASLAVMQKMLGVFYETLTESAQQVRGYVTMFNQAAGMHV